MSTSSAGTDDSRYGGGVCWLLSRKTEDVFPHQKDVAVHASTRSQVFSGVILGRRKCFPLILEGRGRRQCGVGVRAAGLQCVVSSPCLALQCLSTYRHLDWLVVDANSAAP